MGSSLLLTEATAQVNRSCTGSAQSAPPSKPLPARLRSSATVTGLGEQSWNRGRTLAAAFNVRGCQKGWLGSQGNLSVGRLKPSTTLVSYHEE